MLKRKRVPRMAPLYHGGGCQARRRILLKDALGRSGRLAVDERLAITPNRVVGWARRRLGAMRLILERAHHSSIRRCVHATACSPRHRWWCSDKEVTVHKPRLRDLPSGRPPSSPARTAQSLSLALPSPKGVCQTSRISRRASACGALAPFHMPPWRISARHSFPCWHILVGALNSAGKDTRRWGRCPRPPSRRCSDVSGGRAG